MEEYMEVDISDYYQARLDSLKLPEKYEKLIKRIIAINGSRNSVGEIFNVETVADIIKLAPNYFSSCQGVGKLYVDTLIEFKKDLPCFLNQQKQGSNAAFIEDVFTSSDNSYDFSTLINWLELSPKYQKLLKRVLVVMPDLETVQNILDIDVAAFAKLPYVGKSYVDLLINLQNAFLPTDILSTNEHFEQIKLPPQTTLSKLYINYGYLSEKEIKILKKLDKFYGGDIDIRNVSTLLSLNKVNLANNIGFGVSFVNIFNELQNKIKIELSSLSENIAEHTIKERGWFISSEIAFIELNEIDNILIEDIEGYLWTLSEMQIDIALSRWGFNQDYKTLEEVGSNYDLTRERVRQLEKSINKNLTSNFRVQPKVLWANIRENMTDDLTSLLPNLAKCFATDKLFYSFIELCCQVKKGSISEIIFTEIKPKIINALFCNNQSPISKDLIINELMSNYGYGKASAINALKRLEKLGKIKIVEQDIFPKSLGKIEAIAHVLTFHPAGLPWKDIVRIINKKGYFSSILDETIQKGGSFASEFVYLSDHGSYRNLIFLDIEQFDIPAMMQNIHRYFKQHQTKSVHLNDYYYQTKGQRIEIEYFTLRHFVREYGEEYGLYFKGKSGVDSVSLEPNEALFSQADVIIKVLNESKVAMTTQEIAGRLRSKSTSHARFYINNLMAEGKVVRVDQLVYTTPEKAFVGMDIKAITQVIQDVMLIKDLIVEADVFREYVNMELNLSYSKYIYMALVKTYLKDLSWFRNNTLYSKNPIPYKNIMDMCRKLCDPELSNHQNVMIIQKDVWLTDAVAADAIQQWKWQLNH